MTEGLSQPIDELVTPVRMGVSEAVRKALK